MKSTHEVVLESLSGGRWLAPHEVEAQLLTHDIHISPTAVTSRMRDLRKPRYGRYTLAKQTRTGTSYFEYRITNQQQEA